MDRLRQAGLEPGVSAIREIDEATFNSGSAHAHDVQEFHRPLKPRRAAGLTVSADRGQRPIARTLYYASSASQRLTAK
jgi:hypothetical protein